MQRTLDTTLQRALKTLHFIIQCLVHYALCMAISDTQTRRVLWQQSYLRKTFRDNLDNIVRSSEETFWCL